jgi:dimethylamine/trimethylamine dehydrogenase
MSNVDVYRDSLMSTENVLDAGCSLVAIATGATWRSDGVGRAHYEPLEGIANLPVFSPDDVMNGAQIVGPVVVYDDDHYYMGGLMAEVLRGRGLDVTLVTPAAVVSSWTEFTLEQSRIQKGLLKMGVEIVALHEVSAVETNGVRVACIYTGREKLIESSAAVVVTSLWPNDDLYLSLITRCDSWNDHGVQRVTRIGDCYGPGTIAAAVWSGHKYARDLGVPDGDDVPFDRDVFALPTLSA